MNRILTADDETLECQVISEIIRKHFGEEPELLATYNGGQAVK